jgi:cytochrome b561
MRLINSKDSYGLIPQAVHWLTVLFVAAGWLIGKFADFPSPSAPPDFWLLTHIALGQCVIVLLLFRLVWRLANPPPPLEPTRLGRIVEWAARSVHFALYALLLAVPALGIVAELKRAGLLPLFGLWQAASPWPVDRQTGRTILHLHGTLADALLILAGFHAAAAIVHHWLWRDRTLVRMLPGATTAVGIHQSATQLPKS